MTARPLALLAPTLVTLALLGCCPNQTAESGGGFYSRGIKKFDEVPLASVKAVDAKPAGATHLGSVVYDRDRVDATDKAAYARDYVMRIAARNGGDAVVFTTQTVKPDGKVRFVGEVYRTSSAPTTLPAVR